MFRPGDGSRRDMSGRSMESHSGSVASPGRPVEPRSELLVKRLENWLATSRRWIALPLLGVALAIPSLFAGYAIDDHMMRLAVSGDRPACFPASRFDLFVFIADDPACHADLMSAGILPWWVSPRLHLAFFRPIASLSHALDHALWPSLVWLMHAQSLLWFSLMLASVAGLYRRVFREAPAACVAALLYCVDDAHGVAAGWLSNRNALLACTFGMLALLAHDRWRRSGSLIAAIGASLFLATSLLSAEAGVATCAYLLAYALFLDPDSWQRRILTLLPYGVLLVAWRACSRLLGYGAIGSDLYLDPMVSPTAFAVAVATRLPVMLFASIGLPVADVWPLLHDAYRSSLLAIALTLLVPLVAILVPLLRRDAQARFFAMGMLLAAIPVCATFPSERLLTFIDVGALGLVARFLCDHGPRSRVARLLATLWLGVHLGLAPLLLPVRSLAMGILGSSMEHMLLSLGGKEGLAGRDVVLVNPPSDFFPVYLPIIEQLHHRPQPAHTRPLALGVGPVRVTREDPRTLVLHRDEGLFSETAERLLRSFSSPTSIGQTVNLPTMEVTVTEVTHDGLPRTVRFVFPKPLEDPSYLWVGWTSQAAGVWRPPAVGQSDALPAATLRNVFSPSTSDR